MEPIELLFDGLANVEGSTVAHLPVVYQGVPNSYSLKIQDENGNFVNWNQYTEILMRPRWTQGKASGVFTLKKTDGDFITTTDTLTIVIGAAKTEVLEGVTYPAAPIVGSVPFVYDIKGYISGQPVVRIAQGTGLISLDTSRGLA